MVKIPDDNCVRNFWQKVTVCMFSLIYICLDFHEKYVFHKLLCISDTIFLPMVTLRQPLKNMNQLRTYNQPELWETTLKYKNLFSLTSKILGSYMWVFTVVLTDSNLSYSNKFYC